MTAFLETAIGLKSQGKIMDNMTLICVLITVFLGGTFFGFSIGRFLGWRESDRLRREMAQHEMDRHAENARAYSRRVDA